MKEKGCMISVIMPVYNAEKYLKSSIESVLAQSYKNYEFIIVNDGSTDASIDIIQEFKDPRIKCISNEKNSGIVYTLNKGLSISNGEFIARIDADDLCCADRFETQVGFLIKNKRIGLCSGHIIKINDFGEEMGKVKFPISNEACNLKFLFGNPIAHPASMFRKSLALKVGGYTAGSEPAEDLDLWLKLSNITKIENIDKVLIYYRVHANNYSTIKREKYVNKLTTIFNKEEKLKRLIKPEFLNYHFRMIIGTWNEKTSYDELKKVRLWKQCLLKNNDDLKYFTKSHLTKSVNLNIITLLLSVLKSKRNSFAVKILAFRYLFFFNPMNIIEILKNKNK